MKYKLIPTRGNVDLRPTAVIEADDDDEALWMAQRYLDHGPVLVCAVSPRGLVRQLEIVGADPKGKR